MHKGNADITTSMETNAQYLSQNYRVAENEGTELQDLIVWKWVNSYI